MSPIWNIDDAPIDVGGGKIDQGKTAQEDQGWSWRQLLGCHQGEEVGEVAETIPVESHFQFTAATCKSNKKKIRVH